LCLPVIGAGSALMTIDAPYTCCWGWALVFGHQAICRRSAWAWAAVGLVVGVGILAKYTMVLWLPSAGLFLLTSTEHRPLLRGRGFWLATGAAAVCCVPILLWNHAHNWVSVRHVHGLAGLGDETGLHWFGPLAYLGAQCALFLVFWFVVWLLAMAVHRPWVEPDAGVRYLWWMSAPMFALFLALSPKTGGGEANWPVTAYISGLVLAAAWLEQQLQSPRRWYRRWTLVNLTAVCVVGLAVTVLMYHSEWAYPVLRRLSGPPTPERPMPLRRFDPTCRLRGWSTLAAEVDHLRAELYARGEDPVLACTDWSLPGELAFYCHGHPGVYSLGLALGDRHSQYDFWHPNPIAEPDAFAGRTFILIGNVSPRLRQAFDSVDEPHVIIYRERGEPIAAWSMTVGRGFRGLAQFPGATSF
jgi:hypothetical protein